MGSAESKSGLLDVAHCEAMKGAPAPFVKYAQEAGDGLLGFAGCLHTLHKKMDKQAIAYMTNAEKKDFCELETEKMQVIDKIRTFVTKEEYRFGIMQHEAKIGANFNTLCRNVNPEKHCAEIQRMQDDLCSLQKKYQFFKDALLENCRIDGRNNKSSYKFITGCVGCLTMLGCAIACVAFLIIHFSPGINLVLAPLGWACVGLFAAGAVVGGTVLACSLQKDEIDRAMEYMKNLHVNLQNLKESMCELNAAELTITETEEVEAVRQIAQQLKDRCVNIKKVCDEVSKAQFA